MFKRKPLAYTITCVLAAGTLGLGNVALAQDQGEPSETNENEVEEVIVTGSRIKRDSFTASTPSTWPISRRSSLPCPRTR